MSETAWFTVMFVLFLAMGGVTTWSLYSGQSQLAACRDDSATTAKIYRESLQAAIESYEDGCGSCALWNVTLKGRNFVNGIYYGDYYYCIWTRGRNGTEVASTAEHEKCHALVLKERSHFCGADKNNATVAPG